MSKIQIFQFKYSILEASVIVLLVKYLQKIGLDPIPSILYILANSARLDP